MVRIWSREVVAENGFVHLVQIKCKARTDHTWILRFEISCKRIVLKMKAYVVVEEEFMRKSSRSRM